MSYYFSTVIKGDFDHIVDKTTVLLQKEGFGVLTQIDLQQTLKKKLDVDFNRYKILGACNPQFAYKALQIENKVGTMLPCNVIVQELSNGTIEVAAVDPIQSMQAIKNQALEAIAHEVSDKLKNVIKNLKDEK
ncbi:hypothetical protein CJ739_3204 [Mariniflexile rhizosphaerae]|uniref:DUF302 domain-containing protein n=1 Tax=unclassified Mariniflexile TaxID=2643887 RepID=UPI000CAFB167|nr:DUF302 domain-containing protein [Mariniflexile sp. TRM1-10]AXP82266.1 hypothetical protein CJ739_3204 [Mariniflexile sp. TRM1-10]PLB20362.1 MAG: hypothetical protein TRG1_710 [Flavobacteriaceae bacterium FS1-H7996/R]